MKKAVVACVLAAIVATTAQASAGLNAFLVLSGPKGKINGSVIQKGREGSIEVISSEHHVASPSAGARTHSTFTITKEVDASTPRLYAAMIAGDPMDLTLSYYTPSRTGTAAGIETLYYTVKLTKARITEIKFKQPNTKDPNTQRFAEYEEVAFTYQDITWTFVPQNISTQDTKKN